MHGDDGARARGDARLDGLGVHAVVVQADVHEDGPHPVVQHHVRGGDEGGGGHQHLVAVLPAVSFPQRREGHLDGARPAVAEDGVRAAVQPRELRLEALAVRSVGEAVGVQRVVDVLLLARGQPEVADTDLFLHAARRPPRSMRAVMISEIVGRPCEFVYNRPA